MRWTVHGERIVYDSDWIRLALADVEPPGHERFEYHVIRSPAPASGTGIHDPDRGVLLLWRHRFVPDVWGWEIPAGRVDAGESLEQAAVREAVEETGWQPGPLRHLHTYHPSLGLSDQRFALFLAEGATHVGDPSDPTEAERVEWVPVDRLRAEIAAGAIVDGLSLVALLWCLTHDLL
jgi:8-oxo-dGTP pyrophosphatase MutT (NUDIX family)